MEKRQKVSTAFTGKHSPTIENNRDYRRYRATEDTRKGSGKASKPDNTQARTLVQGGPQTEQVVSRGIGRIFPDSLNQMLDDNKDLFKGVGTFNYTHHIKLKVGAEPHVVKVKKIPFHLVDSLRDELKIMEKLGIVQKVNKPTPWDNSLVVVKKPNNSLQICLDPFMLN
ncbi:hypothetical protein PR048_007043 [Dryococelus australis]|uniref:Uncharacterized protein n=1 Tax=Dryococelus australis TaxID=614101 RepID=A0ABQ9ICI5_9NEOP|nr:hypothetical protein PR048_007043 [Dryococelus australis]